MWMDLWIEIVETGRADDGKSWYYLRGSIENYSQSVINSMALFDCQRVHLRWMKLYLDAYR